MTASTGWQPGCQATGFGCLSPVAPSKVRCASSLPRIDDGFGMRRPRPPESKLRVDDEAGVHQQRCRGDIAGVLRQEEGDAGGKFGRLADASQSDALEIVFHDIRRIEQAGTHVRGDGTRLDDVDAYI